MEEKGKAEELVRYVRQYLRTHYEIAVLSGFEKLSGAGARIITALVVVLVSLLAIMLLGFSAAYYLSEMIGDPWSGFLIVGGAFFLLLLIIIIFRKPLFLRPIRNRIIRKALSN